MLFLQINPDTFELVEEEVASCDEILAQEVSNIKEISSVKEISSLNLSANSTPEKNSNSNENLQIKTSPEQVETTPNPPLFPMAIQQGGPIFSQKQRPLKKRILNEQNGQNFLGIFYQFLTDLFTLNHLEHNPKSIFIDKKSRDIHCEYVKVASKFDIGLLIAYKLECKKNLKMFEPDLN